LLFNGWNEAKSILRMFGPLKQAATLDIASPDCHPSPLHHLKTTPVKISLE